MSAPVTTRVEIVQHAIDDYLANARPVASQLAQTDRISAETSLTVRQALAIFEDQVTSRLLDVAARELKRRNEGFYTISSAGHENNAIIGTLLRLDDTCFLHYRSGALMLARAHKLPGTNMLFDTLVSFCASADDPIAQGRHKVWGSYPLRVLPQTSTIASHLPKAAGFAFALRQARRLGRMSALADDAIVCCSFGDASVNHATALSGINAARYTVRRGGPAPILFLCEDNGIGISVETPANWIRDSFCNLPHLRYYEADGTIDEIWDVAEEAIRTCRDSRAPVFLHLHVTRLWGHAGTDVETTYHTLEEIAAAEA
ncbi:MAG: MFS transporter, partial [Blastocatellia bacterium]|nr:MFS transporter [Blastocatellia bacterium]